MLLVFGVALLLRAGWVLARWHSRDGRLEFPDEQIHWQLAYNLATRGQMVTDDGRYAARMPGYPLFLLPLAMFGTGGILAAQLVQAVLGAATAALAAWCADRWLSDMRPGRADVHRPSDAKDRGGQPPSDGRSAARLTHPHDSPPGTGLIAGLLVALDPYAIFFSGLILTEVLFTFEAILLFASAAQWLRQPAGRLALTGVAVCGSAAVMTRPSSAGWVVLLWVVLLVVKRFDARAWRLVAVSALALAAVMIPWALRNRAVIGGPAWLSTNGGVTLYDALGPQATGASDQSFLERMPELRGMTEVQRDRYLYGRALEQIRRDPARVLALAWVKFVRTWNPLPNDAGYRASPAAWIGAGYTGLLLIAALVGLCTWRGDPATLSLILLPIVYFSFLHSVFIGSVRYRIPLMPFVALLAASGLARIARRGRGTS